MLCVALAMFLTLSVLHCLKFKTLILDIQTITWHGSIPPYSHRRLSSGKRVHLGHPCPFLLGVCLMSFPPFPNLWSILARPSHSPLLLTDFSSENIPPFSDFLDFVSFVLLTCLPDLPLNQVLFLKFYIKMFPSTQQYNDILLQL